MRPILDAIGLGASKLSEIAGRLGQPATSLSRPMERLRNLGYVEREIPFGTNEITSKRVLYKIKDYFLKFWFDVVAAKKSIFIQIPKKSRITLLKEALPAIWSQGWESMCRKAIPFIFANQGNFLIEPARRYWHGNNPEWDIVSTSFDKKTLIIGEVKWSKNLIHEVDLQRLVGTVISKPLPLPVEYKNILYVIFVSAK